jgi:GntR family transcriptional regulator
VDFARQSLYEILTNEYHLIITQIAHSISAAAADRLQAELLNVEPGAPLLVVNTSAFLENDEIIEFTVSYYRADKYEYTITQSSV